MSDRLKLGLSASTSEIEGGISEAEAELTRLRQRSRELQDLIALGRVTLLAAQLNPASGRASALVPPVVRIPEAQPGPAAGAPPSAPAAPQVPPPSPAGPPPDPTELRQKLGRAAESRSAGPDHAIESAEHSKPSRSKK